MYEYVITFWDAKDGLVGLDIQRWDTFVDPMFPEGLPVNIPDNAVRCVISCELVSDASLCYVAGYEVTVKNGKG